MGPQSEEGSAANFASKLAEFGQHCPKLPQLVARDLASFVRGQAKIGPPLQNLAESGPTLAQLEPTLVQIARLWPKPVKEVEIAKQRTRNWKGRVAQNSAHNGVAELGFGGTFRQPRLRDFRKFPKVVKSDISGAEETWQRQSDVRLRALCRKGGNSATSLP